MTHSIPFLFVPLFSRELEKRGKGGGRAREMFGGCCKIWLSPLMVAPGLQKKKLM